MKKSRAVIALILVAVITGLMAYTALVGLGSGHRGSYHNIKLGLDLAGGGSVLTSTAQRRRFTQRAATGSISRSPASPASKRPTRSLKNWVSPALCILSDRQMKTETRTMNSELTRTAITAMS